MSRSTSCPCCLGTGRLDPGTLCANCGSPLEWHLPPEHSCTREDRGGALRQVPGVFTVTAAPGARHAQAAD